MKERLTMKQQHCATGRWLSNICRGLMLLGCIKISLFVALAFGYPLPSISFDFLPAGSTSEADTASVHNDGAGQDSAKVLAQMMKDANVSDAHMQAEAQDGYAPVAQPQAAPQGSDAVRAAEEYTQRLEAMLAQENARRQNGGQNDSQAVAAAPAQNPRPLARKPVEENPRWWSNLQNITSLPIPSLGLEQVAYAATLDTPPPPNVPPAAASPFMPSQQGVAPRSAAPTEAIVPAGTAGPQVGIVQQSPLVPNPNPPVPTLHGYVPPEDPIRKQQELARREQEILTLQRQMEQRLEELRSAEKKVQGMLNEAKQVEGDKVTALTDMYVNMKPRQAAAALESMDEAVAVKILASIPAKQAGEILSYANPEKTAVFTEMLTRMQLQ